MADLDSADTPGAAPELAELADATKAADSPAPAPGERAAPGAPIALSVDEQAALEWSMVPSTMGSIIVRALPEVKDDWNEANCLEWGRKFAPIARKYGWTVGDFMAWLGPWIPLVIVTEKMMTPTIIAGYKRIQAARAAAARAKGLNETPPPAAA